MAAVKVVESDVDFQKQIKANKFVLAIFMEDDTEIEVRVEFFEFSVAINIVLCTGQPY